MSFLDYDIVLDYLSTYSTRIKKNITFWTNRKPQENGASYMAENDMTMTEAKRLIIVGRPKLLMVRVLKALIAL